MGSIALRTDRLDESGRSRQDSGSPLAILGGPPVRTKPYPWHVTTDGEDVEGAKRVLESGILSVFEGSNTPYFLGGDEVKSLEAEWAVRFGVKHAVAMNSATSGLMAAVGAIGVGPGDEVIVSPWTMTATAAAVLAYNAIPVFADVTDDTYALDPESVRRVMTRRTKAIMVTHLYGHPADMDPLLELARPHRLAVIEDAAQSPGAMYHGRPTGTLGAIGVFSLNSNKIIQCGEGGVAVTQDDELALRLRLIRNHAEAAIATGVRVKSLVNMLGWNYRMNEVEAAISRVQLRKLDGLLERRLALVNYLNDRLADLPGVRIPVAKAGCTHSYYRYAVKLDRSVMAVSARFLAKILNAEGLDFYPGYEPLYLQPLYQNRQVYGDKGCPFTCAYYEGAVRYDRGTCPTAERLQDEVLSTETVRPPQTFRDMDEIVTVMEKVLDHREDLARLDGGPVMEQVR